MSQENNKYMHEIKLNSWKKKSIQQRKVKIETAEHIFIWDEVENTNE